MSEKTNPEKIGTEQLSGVTGGISAFGGSFGSGMTLWQSGSGDSSSGEGIGLWQPGGEAGVNVHLTAGDDLRNGTSGNDTIQSYGGADTIWAGAGNDKVFGGDGNDWLQGGTGADEIHGGAGDDYIEGNVNNADGDGASDTVFAGTGNDTFAWTKGSGNDQFHGNEGTDTLRLQDVSVDELLRGLSTDDTRLMLKHEGNGIYSFVLPNGTPVQDVAGTFRIGGETVTFYNLEKVQIG